MTTDDQAAGPGSRPGAAVRVLLALIGFYRTAISPLRPPACRYLPTCSEYAVDALRTWGLARGTALAARRLLRCHPWHAGGHDPVPPRPPVTVTVTVTDGPHQPQRLAAPLSSAAR